MKKLILLFITVISIQARAQSFETKVKELEQHGVPFFYNADIEKNIQLWLKNENSVTGDILGKSVLYFPYMDNVRKVNGLPWFVKYIPAANTGYNNYHVGKDGSTGMWPLNFSIAKKYGLKMNSMIDERRALDASSDAACKYLADLHFIYKDWLKTITAFRIGAIRLNQVIRLSGNSLDFKDIYEHLEPEEREPIVQFISAVTVMYFREDFKIQESDLHLPLMDSVSANVALPFSLIEQKTGIKAQDLKNMNPEFKTENVPYFGYTIYFNVPKEQKPAYNAMRDSLFKIATYKPQPVIEYDTIIKVVDSVTYIEIVPKGSKPIEDKPDSPTPNVGVTPKPPAKVWVWYKVKPGDGFYTLSDIFDCSIAEMKSWNGIRNNALIANTSIKFYVNANKVDYYKKMNYLNQAQKRNIALQD